jgi:hypothetical protein
VPDVPGLPSAEELSALPRAELAVRLAEAYLLIGRLQERVEELERRAGRDSSVSSRPPSSDSPYKKKPRDRAAGAGEAAAGQAARRARDDADAGG